jgi:predicted nuclease with TOPRIM domain
VTDILEINNILHSEVNERQSKIKELRDEQDRLINNRFKVSGKELHLLAEQDGLDKVQDELLKLIQDKTLYNKLQYWATQIKKAVTIKRWRLYWQIGFQIVFAVIAMAICIAGFFILSMNG